MKKVILLAALASLNVGVSFAVKCPATHEGFHLALAAGAKVVGSPSDEYGYFDIITAENDQCKMDEKRLLSLGAHSHLESVNDERKECTYFVVNDSDYEGRSMPIRNCFGRFILKSKG